MSQIAFQFRQLIQRMWFLPAAFSLLAVITVLVAYFLARFAPEKLPFTMPSNGVASILTILASSMLTVAVFALSTIVSALSTASASTTPRAAPLIVGDRSAQASISVFIGAFLFAIVGIIGLNSGIYSEAGRLFLFLVTLGVVVLVVAALIRWIGQISAIGRVSHTIDRVEGATAQAFDSVNGSSDFGCLALTGSGEGEPLRTDQVAYVQHLDADRLQELAEEHDLRIVVLARPGAFLWPGRPLALVGGRLEADVSEKLVAAFTLGDHRTFDSDPRFGLVVLAEIAGRALSPAVNDPGTAIDVISSLVRVLHGRNNSREANRKEPHRNDRISLATIVPGDLIEDGFRPIARDGAGTIEVVIRLLAGLEALVRSDPELRAPALDMAWDATERARAALTAPSDLRRLETAAAFVTR